MEKNKKAKKSMPTGPIARDSNIMEIVSNYPEAVPVLLDAGLHCIGCQLSAMDTLEQGCEIHGIENGKIDELVKEINQRIRKFRAKK